MLTLKLGQVLQIVKLQCVLKQVMFREASEWLYKNCLYKTTHLYIKMPCDQMRVLLQERPHSCR